MEKIRQGLAHRGERLVEVRRHIGETCSGRRHGWQAEGSARLIDILQGLGDLCVRHGKGRLFLVVFFLAHDLAREQLLRTVKLLLRQCQACLAFLPGRHALPDERDLVIHVLDGVSRA